MYYVKECPVCTSGMFEDYLNCKDHSISQENFKLQRCMQCGLILTNPRPHNTDLGKYYASSNYISHSDTSKGLINKLYHSVRKFTLQSKIQLIKKYYKNPVLLDIGSGAGYFLNACIENNFKSIGIEPDETTRMHAINRFGHPVFDENHLNQLQASSFDVITLWHVLEHIPDLSQRLNQIYGLLKQDGMLIIAVPNCDSADAKHYGAAWAGYDVPRHLWYFTPDTMKLLMTNNGFKIYKILPMIFDSYYVSMLSEKYKSASLGFLKGMYHGLKSNIKAYLAQEKKYSSQIYLIQKK